MTDRSNDAPGDDLEQTRSIPDPVDDTPVEEAPVEETPVEETPVGDEIAEEALDLSDEQLAVAADQAVAAVEEAEPGVPLDLPDVEADIVADAEADAATPVDEPVPAPRRRPLPRNRRSPSTRTSSRQSPQPRLHGRRRPRRLRPRRLRPRRPLPRKPLRRRKRTSPPRRRSSAPRKPRRRRKKPPSGGGSRGRRRRHRSRRPAHGGTRAGRGSPGEGGQGARSPGRRTRSRWPRRRKADPHAVPDRPRTPHQGPDLVRVRAGLDHRLRAHLPERDGIREERRVHTGQDPEADADHHAGAQREPRPEREPGRERQSRAIRIAGTLWFACGVAGGESQRTRELGRSVSDLIGGCAPGVSSIGAAPSRTSLLGASIPRAATPATTPVLLPAEDQTPARASPDRREPSAPGRTWSRTSWSAAGSAIDASSRRWRSTPREAFVPGVPTSMRLRRPRPADRCGPDDQPAVHGRAHDRAARRSRPGDRILEVGTGSGYQAAVLARLGAQVTTIERHADLAESARERLEGARHRARRGPRRRRQPGRARRRAVGRDRRHGRRAVDPRRRCASSWPRVPRLVIPVGAARPAGPHRRRAPRAQRLGGVVRRGGRVRAPRRRGRLARRSRAGREGWFSGDAFLGRPASVDILGPR